MHFEWWMATRSGHFVFRDSCIAQHLSKSWISLGIKCKTLNDTLNWFTCFSRPLPANAHTVRNYHQQSRLSFIRGNLAFLNSQIWQPKYFLLTTASANYYGALSLSLSLLSCHARHYSNTIITHRSTNQANSWTKETPSVSDNHGQLHIVFGLN